MAHSRHIVLRIDLYSMKKKRTTYHAEIDYTPTKEIHLNVNYLQPGKYVLKIMYKNKVIKKTNFKK